MIKKIFSYALRFAVAPMKTASAISADRSGVWAALWWILIFLGAYTVTAFIYFLLGHLPVAKAFMTVSKEKWYLVQTFTTIPVGLAGFIAEAGLAYFICKAIGGKGSFEATFSIIAYAVIIPCVVFMLLLELLVAPFFMAFGYTTVPWPQWVETLRVFVLPFAWIFFIATISLSKIHKITWPAALGISVLSMVPTGIIMAVFIR
jgi:hypothetical protein